MKTYTIVNPQIGGSIKTSYLADSARDAAKKAYKAMSKYFSNNIPQFTFTLKENGGGHSHFTVKEKIDSKGDNVKYVIKEINNEGVSQEHLKNIEEANKVDVIGGGKKFAMDDSDSSSSDSDSDSDSSESSRKKRREKNRYNYFRQADSSFPIYYWKYYPYLYPYSEIYLPQFSLEVAPYVYVKLSP